MWPANKNLDIVGMLTHEGGLLLGEADRPDAPGELDGAVHLDERDVVVRVRSVVGRVHLDAADLNIERIIILFYLII